MNPLDARARRATSAINDSLAMAAAPAPFATIVRRAIIVKAINVAMVGAGLVLFIAAGAAFRTPQPQTPVAETVTSTTSEAPPLTTTLPPDDGGSAIVALPTATSTTTSSQAPAATSSTAPPSTTTSSTTTQAPPTTTTKAPPTTTTEPPDTTPPVIEIVFPKNRQRFTEPGVTFRGVTEPGAKVTVGKLEAELGDAGQWRIKLRLRDGRNRVVFTATDAAGNAAQAEVVVFYEPPDVAAFTAHATFGSCEEDPPYDVYHGTGEPGSAVGVVSQYGSGATRVNAEGVWELKVFFPDAPPGETFLVRAADEYGRARTFEFVSNAGGADG